MLTEQIVTFDRLEELTHVLGSVDENLDALERAFDVHMTFREGGIKIMGESEAVALAARALESLMQMASKGEQIDTARVNYVVGLTREGEEDKLRELGGDVICVTAKGKPIKAKTLGQQKYIDAIRKKHHRAGDRAGRNRQDLSCRRHGGGRLPGAQGQPPNHYPSGY